jgi:hypothetical protein
LNVLSYGSEYSIVEAYLFVLPTAPEDAPIILRYLKSLSGNPAVATGIYDTDGGLVTILRYDDREELGGILESLRRLARMRDPLRKTVSPCVYNAFILEKI